MIAINKLVRNKILWSFLPAFLFLADNIIGQEIPLQDWKAFESPSKFWKLGGEININPFEVGSFDRKRGKGILVGSASPSEGISKLSTKMTHGDISVEFEFLLGHETSAVLYLQGRYGLQLKDAALIPPENMDSFGYLPGMNSGRAPGIWQHIKIDFDAPRFDASGKKTHPARIVSVTLNDLIIQENQYMQAPSREAPFPDEVLEGPLVFGISKGDIAIRNIHHTRYSGERIELEGLSYKLYRKKFLEDEFVFWGGGEGDSVPIPDFESYEVENSGELEAIHTQMARDLEKEFALVFQGKMRIPESGKYHFEAVENGLGSFIINQEELFRWNTIHGKGELNASVELEEGVHDFTLNYINHRQPNTGIFVEGMGVKRQLFHLPNPVSPENTTRPIILYPQNKPLIQRSFTFFNGKKLLSVINVGHPNKIHYSLDLSTGSLLQAWRGGFGDVTPMWHGRGEDQVLQPLGSVIKFTEKPQVLLSKDQDPKSAGENYQLIGYDLQDNGEPVFIYRVGNIEIRDRITSGNEEKFIRILEFSNPAGTEQEIWFKIAAAPSIEMVKDQLYSIADNTYYVEVIEGTDSVIQDEGEEKSLLIPVKVGRDPQKLEYSLVW